MRMPTIKRHFRTVCFQNKVRDYVIVLHFNKSATSHILHRATLYKIVELKQRKFAQFTATPIMQSCLLPHESSTSLPPESAAG